MAATFLMAFLLQLVVPTRKAVCRERIGVGRGDQRCSRARPAVKT